MQLYYDHNHYLAPRPQQPSPTAIDVLGLERIDLVHVGRDRHRMHQKDSTKVAQQSIQADAVFGWGSRTWARLVEQGGNDTYYYFFFTQPPPVFNLYLPDRPPMDIPEGPRGYGAYHSGDLAYAFANLHLVGSGWNDDDQLSVFLRTRRCACFESLRRALAADLVNSTL